MRKFLIALISITSACTQYSPGPDKTVAGAMQGAASGAISGAVLGAETTGIAGPAAAWTGAGFGAISGAVKGAFQDANEEERRELQAAISRERQTSYVHARLAEQYERRLELHPTRDIYPADWFFSGDEVKLRPSGKALVREIAKMNKDRLPYSRLAIAVYTKSKDENSEYAQFLSKDRAAAITNFLIRNGIEAKRLEARAVILNEPLLLDRFDDPERYNQAVEIIALDN